MWVRCYHTKFRALSNLLSHHLGAHCLLKMVDVRVYSVGGTVVASYAGVDPNTHISRILSRLRRRLRRRYPNPATPLAFMQLGAHRVLAPILPCLPFLSQKD